MANNGEQRRCTRKPGEDHLFISISRRISGCRSCVFPARKSLRRPLRKTLVVADRLQERGIIFHMLAGFPSVGPRAEGEIKGGECCLRPRTPA